MYTADSTSQIKFGAILSYISIGINILIGLLYTPWMIRSIGKADYGLYILAMSVITLFVFDFGLSAAVTRFVARYLAEGRKDMVGNCLGLVYKIYLGIDIVICLLLTGIYFFIPMIYQELTPGELAKFKIVYVIAAAFSVISFPFIPVAGVLSAYEKFIQLKLCDLIHKLIIVVLMAGCLFCGYGLYALVLVNSAAGIAAILLKIWCIKKYTKEKINFFYSNRQELYDILGYSGWITVIAIMQRCIFNIAPSILGMLSGSASIAVFGVAMTLEGYIYTFASALSGMFLPKVSRIMTAEQGSVLPLMIRVGRIQCFIANFIIFGFFILGREFIRLWLGAAFNASYLCAVLLIIPSVVQLPQEIASTAVAVANKVKLQAWAFTAMAAVNLILSFIFTPLWGVIGLSASICAAYLVRTAGMNIIYYRTLKINIFKFFKESFGRLLFPTLLIGAVGWGMNLLWRADSWISLIAKGILYSLCYGGIMFLAAMNTSEKELLLAPVKRIFKHFK